MAPANPTSGAPTGCFKCGRPGHWSRDCPSSASSSDPAAKLPPSQQHNAAASGGNWKPSSNPASSSSWKTGKAPPKPATAKPTLPRKRPKLTPDLLLSNEGLGYVLEHFPRMVKIQGPGHEVDDLKSLLEAYIHWHSRILPYFSFNQFVERVEKVGSTKRIRKCVNDLKDKVAMGDEPKLTLKEQNPDGVEGDEDLSFDHDLPSKGGNSKTWEEPRDDTFPADIHEDMFDEFYKQAVEEGPDLVPHSTPQTVGLSKPVANDSVVDSTKLAPSCINEEQKIRIEANRLRALERAKARMAAALAT